MSVSAAVAVAGLTKRYKLGEAAILNLNFQIAEGEVCALLGGNGAGKTTTLAILLGLLAPTAGSVTVLGVDLLRQRHRVLARMNFSSPYVDLPHRLTVSENLKVYAALYGVRGRRQRIAELARQLDLTALLDRAYGGLSAGQKTRVSLAKALINRPSLLLLDEPTASLDPDTADRIRSSLLAYRRESGASFVLASHNMLEVERIADRVLMLRRGQLVDAATPAELLQRYGRESLEEVFLEVARHVG
ncbi:MAG TPA: ABC transporter ATP-binding protein [Acidiferrobacteraceae bacterium]|nr:ABC transporter ATP-binding protein [Acidiferrobacteraceae bacterium]